jgi:hypothetical protein
LIAALIVKVAIIAAVSVTLYVKRRRSQINNEGDRENSWDSSRF